MADGIFFWCSTLMFILLFLSIVACACACAIVHMAISLRKHHIVKIWYERRAQYVL